MTTGADDAMAAIVAKLVAAGVRATTDQSALNPPGVLVLPPGRTYDLGCGYSAHFALYAVGPAPTGSGAGSSIGILNQLLDDIAGAGYSGEMSRIAYPHGSQMLPAFIIYFTEVCD
jgi:hypothetical protein